MGRAGRKYESARRKPRSS